MSKFKMSDYLPTLTADYDYTLNIIPDEELPILPEKNQTVIPLDDGDDLVIELNSIITFVVPLVFRHLSEDYSKIVMDLWCDPLKANGLERTFKWYNPWDTGIYVVRFKTIPSLRILPTYYQGIDNINLSIRGKDGS